jgi:hypothetical protein
MEKKPQSKLAARREAFRLWFEYLKIARLRLSSDTKIRSALVVSEPYYRPWEMDKAERFDHWWKVHAHLFEEKFTVRELKAGEAPMDPDALLIEVPLTQSPTVLTKNVKAIIQAAFEAREQTERKSKKKPTAYYRLSEGSEPKLDAVREMLSVYRDVHLKNPKLKGEKLLDATHRYYLGRKNKKWAKVPIALMYADGGKIRAMRNLRRYIQKAEQVVLNVARGQFPGEY